MLPDMTSAGHFGETEAAHKQVSDATTGFWKTGKALKVQSQVGLRRVIRALSEVRSEFRSPLADAWRRVTLCWQISSNEAGK